MSNFQVQTFINVEMTPFLDTHFKFVFGIF